MLNERKLTKAELNKREDIIMKMKKNKRQLVKRYGKDAEKVMYGRATQLAKKQAEAMDQDRIKEMVKTALMGPMKEDQVEEGNAFIVAADAARDTGKKEFEFPEGSGKMHPVTVKADIDELDATEKAASDKIGRGEEFTDDDAAAVADKMPKIGKDKEFKLMGEAFLLDSDIEDIVNALGYSDVYRFFEDNPGAVSSILDWAENVPEFNEMLQDADLLQERKKIVTEDKMEALMELRNILDELQVLGDQARDIIAQNFPSFLSKGEAYGAFDMGSSSNRYDTTLASIVADIEEYGDEEDEDMMQEDLDLGHQDNEPHMLKADLYRIGKYAMELYQMLDKFEAGSEEVDLPHWWQSKIIKSKDAIIGAKHYLDFEIKEPQIDAMVDVAQDVEAIDEFDNKSMKAYGDAVKKAYGVKDKKDSLASLLDKYDLDMGWYKKHLLGIDELTPAELKDLEYVEDRIKAHLSNEGKLNEGVWALGSAEDIRNAIKAIDQMMDLKNPKDIIRYISKLDGFLYNVIGDDLFHDNLGGAEREAKEGNLDRAHNRLIDAKGRAEELLKHVESYTFKESKLMEKEQNLARPNTSSFGEIAEKLAQQLKSK